MGSIYEYSLQYKPGVGRCVPDFIMVHGVHDYCAYTDTYFGYSESGYSGRGVIEYASKQALADRIHQIHNLTPYVKNIGTLEEPELVDLTQQEVNDKIDVLWAKMTTIKAVFDGEVPVHFYLNDFEVQHYYANIGLNGDTWYVVSCMKSDPSDEFDVYWLVAPVKTGDVWVQTWDGRQFTAYELEEYKAKKKAKINEERYAAIDTGFISASLGKLVNSDLTSRVNIDQELIKATISEARGEPSYNIGWRFGDGTIVDISREDFIVLGEERRAFIESEYQKSWARKAAVEVATSRKDIDGA